MPKATYSTTSFRFHRYTGSPISSSICSRVCVREMGFQPSRGRADDDCFEAERIEQARKVLERKDTVAVLCVSKIPTIILQSPARENILLRGVIQCTHAPTKHRRSPGVHCTSLGRLGGDEPARLTDAKPGTKDRQGLKWRVWRLPTVTAFP